MRWDQSPECRAIIERSNKAYQQQSQERCAHELRMNDFDHAQHLDWLERCVQYVHNDQVHAFASLFCRFAEAEQQRLGERIAIMQQHGLERAPHTHQEREKKLTQELKRILAAKMGVEVSV